MTPRSQVHVNENNGKNTHPANQCQGKWNDEEGGWKMTLVRMEKETHKRRHLGLGDDGGRDVCEVKMSKWCITVMREGESIDRQQRLPRGSYVAQNLSKKPLFQ